MFLKFHFFLFHLDIPYNLGTSTFTVGGKPVTTYQADVNDLGTFTPDTESIVGGEFAESVFRSAPSFDIDIDGITNIDA